MIFSHNESIEDAIIRLVSPAPLFPRELHTKIEAEGAKVSLQAVYKAVRILLQSGVLVKSKHKVGVSNEWCNQVLSALNSHAQTLTLSEGEHVTYEFNSLSNLDAYWKHVIGPLQETHADMPVFIYNPFEFWYHVESRKKSESLYFHGFTDRKQYAFYVIGNTSKLDTEFKKLYQNDYLQIDCWQKTSFPSTYCYIVVADYVILTKLPEKLMSAIASIYTKNTESKIVEQELTKLLSGKYRAQVKIFRNQKKAKMIRKKLFKNFYLPPEVRLKHDLF